ncbi:hypothetical protein [Streptococcus hyovaginalis]|uniref:hypothetical protein n=1 Tax=Streptococcus hyovaginalis TaxID=149015 RepID=UPI003BF82992
MKTVKQADLEQFVSKETLKIIDSNSRKDGWNDNYNNGCRLIFIYQTRDDVELEVNYDVLDNVLENYDIDAQELDRLEIIAFKKHIHGYEEQNYLTLKRVRQKYVVRKMKYRFLDRDKYYF